MVADVPLGSFLSGGIDSSTIVAMMKHHSDGRRIGTYTIGIEAEDLRYDIIPDDVEWARRVNQQLDTDYHEIMLQPTWPSCCQSSSINMDEPGDPIWRFPVTWCRGPRAKTLTVMLSGMGGDEVFAGYPRQMAMRLAGAFDPVPQMLRRPVMKRWPTLCRAGCRVAYRAAAQREEIRAAVQRWISRIVILVTGLISRTRRRRGFTRKRCAGPPAASMLIASIAAISRARKNAAPLNQLLYVDLKTFLPCLNLMTTDKTSMAANLEVRVPFLNQEMLN